MKRNRWNEKKTAEIGRGPHTHRSGRSTDWGINELLCPGPRLRPVNQVETKYSGRCEARLWPLPMQMYSVVLGRPNYQLVTRRYYPQKTVIRADSLGGWYLVSQAATPDAAPFFLLHSHLEQQHEEAKRPIRTGTGDFESTRNDYLSLFSRLLLFSSFFSGSNTRRATIILAARRTTQST